MREKNVRSTPFYDDKSRVNSAKTMSQKYCILHGNFSGNICCWDWQITFIVDFSILIEISHGDHVVNIFVSQFFSHQLHRRLQLVLLRQKERLEIHSFLDSKIFDWLKNFFYSCNETVVVLVKNVKSCHQIILRRPGGSIVGQMCWDEFKKF